MKKAVALCASIVVLFGQALLAEAGRGRHGFSHHFEHRRFFVGTTVFVGPAFWGPPWWWDPYWYPAYPPPVVIPEEPPVYVQQSQPAPPPPVASYWYYCPDAKAYYPYVQQCPTAWLKVVPETTPSQQ